LLSRLGGCEGARGNICIPRIECANTRRKKHCEEYGDDDKQPPAAFHDQPSFVLEMNLLLKMLMAHSQSTTCKSLGTAPKPKCQGMILAISCFPRHMIDS
jgi:hypothetical protein